jgi:probable F420-dependent oxidoreductase
MNLGQYGVWTSYRQIGVENASDAARLAQSLGYGTFWLGGSPRLPDVRALLAATDRLVVATGIVNVWQHEPAQLAAEYQQLSGEFPDRLLVGIGIGHPEATSDYSKPLTTMRGFLDGIDGSPAPIPRDRRCLAALAPRMLALCADRTAGAHTYFVPVEHTRDARARLGDSPLLAPELACVLDTDTDTAGARATARRYAQLYLGLRNYTGNLLRLGFGESDIADGGSDRLIDAVIPHGGADDVAAAARAHLEAGADHVCVQPLGARGVPCEQWTALASALIS